MEYWYAVAGRRFGPYSPGEFDALLRSGQVPVTAWVYPPAAGRWIPVADAVAQYPPVIPGPAPAAAVPARLPMNSLAITSFVVALVSIPLSFVLVGFALAVVAIVLAHLAMRDLRRAREREQPQGGQGLAITGLVVGYGMVAFCALLLVAAVLPSPTPPSPTVTDADVRTDLRNAATAQDAVYTENQEYTQSIGVLRANGFAPVSGADFVVSVREDGYCISAFRDDAATLHLDSDTGPGDGPCDEQLT